MGELSRRQILEMCGMGSVGLTLPEFFHAKAAAAGTAANSRTFGKARSVVLLFMCGGPAHQDTFDLKPDAPADVRGEFKPVETNVSGIQICEHYREMAKIADKFAILRSVTHPGIDHSTSAYEMLTGRRHPNPGERRDPGPDDFPHLGAVLARYHAVQRPVPPFVAMPETFYITGGAPQIPGQTGGFMGRQYDPFRITGDFSKPSFRVPDITLPDDVNEQRFSRRHGLLGRMRNVDGYLSDEKVAEGLDENYQRAFAMLSSTETRRAFDLSREPGKVREAYGMNRHGQAVLVARRLVEAGVPFICVYWHRENPKVDTTWDTHGNNFSDLKNRLIPQTDAAHSMLLRELDQRGLLDSTLVVWMGEFGRTPKVNANAGRDHWGYCGAAWLAGAGIRGGQVHGASDPIAAHPASDPVSPADIAATIYHSMGLDPRTEMRDRLDRPYPLAEGEPLHCLYG
jgi:hypothetical protein